MGFIERQFRLRELETDFWTEVRAGTTTFLTMSYILFLNPHILGQPNTDLTTTDVVIGTAVASAFGSFGVGLLANLPFGCAPGLGLSAYLSYGLVKGKNLPWEGAFSSAFFAGLVITFLGVTNLADACMRFIPITIKVATVIGMGLLLTFIGFQSIQLVVAASDDSLVKLGPLDRPEVWISLSGLMILATLSHHRVRAGVLIGILVVTVIVWTMNHTWPSQIIELPILSGPIYYETTQVKLILHHFGEYTEGILAFLLVGIFDVSGVMFGLAVLAGLDKEDAQGHTIVPNSKYVFIVCGIATAIAAALGCSPIIVHIESAAGVKEGGRSGLSAVVVGVWFIFSIIFAPLFGAIPQEATAPVVVLIGASMMAQSMEIDWKQMRIAVPAFLTLSLMPFTFSIPNGIFFGLLSNAFLSITCGDFFGKPSHNVFDDPSHHSVGGGRPINETGKALSYGTVGSAHVGMPRNYSTDSFVRSPTLILRSEEYTGAIRHT